MREVSEERLLEVWKLKGYKLNTNLFGINLFGIRSEEIAAKTYKDIIGIAYVNLNGIWVIRQFAGTTDPLLYWRTYFNVQGDSIMTIDQHENCFSIVKDYNGVSQFDIQQVGEISYINKKKPNKTIKFLYKLLGKVKHKVVNKITPTESGIAGNQVIANEADYMFIINCILTSTRIHNQPNLFSYTLFNEKDLR